MEVKEIPLLTTGHKIRICELWNNEYPQKLVNVMAASQNVYFILLDLGR